MKCFFLFTSFKNNLIFFFRCNCQNLIAFVFNLFEITNKQYDLISVLIDWACNL